MHTYRIFPLLLLLCLPAFFSCRKAPLDSNIEGMWRLDRLTTLADGADRTDCHRIFYSIQLQLVEVAEKQCTHGYPTCIGLITYNDDHSRLTMKSFRRRESTGDNGKPVPVEDLLPYGMNATESTFEVLKADGRHLVLQSDYARLEFTRF